MGLRTRRIGKGGYREAVPELENWAEGKGIISLFWGFWNFFMM